MIKFNQFVRASVLSAAMFGSLGLASHAFAYDAQDIYEAQQAFTLAQDQLNDDSYYAYTSIPQQREDAYYAMVQWKDGCQWLGPTQDAVNCIFDAEDWYQLQMDDLDATYDDYVYNKIPQDTMDYNNAAAWLDTVTNDQNGQHGVP